jgi:hypothetical protein
VLPTRPGVGLALQQLDRVLAEYRDQLGAEAVDRVRGLLERCQSSSSWPDAADLAAESRRWPRP